MEWKKQSLQIANLYEVCPVVTCSHESRATLDGHFKEWAYDGIVSDKDESLRRWQLAMILGGIIVNELVVNEFVYPKDGS